MTINEDENADHDGVIPKKRSAEGSRRRIWVKSLREISHDVRDDTKP